MGVEVCFPNSTAHRHCRLLFPAVRNAGAAVAVQIAEVEFLGWIGSAPADFASFFRTDIGTSLAGRSSAAYLRLGFTLEGVPRPVCLPFTCSMKTALWPG